MGERRIAVTVTGRHAAVPPALRAYAQLKAEGLGRCDPGVTRVAVVLAVDGQETTAACVIHRLRGPSMATEAAAADAWTAVDRAVGKSLGRLKRVKKRRRVHRDRGQRP